MKSILKIVAFIFILGHYPLQDNQAQRAPVKSDSSALAGVRFPREALNDRRLLSTAAAKTVLEMEASKYSIGITGVEVYSFPATEVSGEDGKVLTETIIKSFEKSGYGLWPAEGNASYTWLGSGRKKILMYISSTKKQTELYLGLASTLPPLLTSPVPQVTGTPESAIIETATAGTGQNAVSPPVSNQYSTGNSSNILPGLVGYWGTLSGSKINYQDGTTGMIVSSGVSRGFGIELRADGTYLQVSVVNSGYPTYRIFVSTTGRWEVNGNLMVFTPSDRHYRKWDYEIKRTDEHSIPEPYTMIWMLQSNQVTGKQCLYVKYTADQPAWEELCRE